MEDTWIPMLRPYEHGPGALMINVRFRDEGSLPDPARPSASTIIVRFNDPDQSGMGSHADAGAIDDAWDAVHPSLALESQIEFVSRLRYEGEARILVYSPASSRARIEAAARSAFPDHSVTFEHADDPLWSKYQAMLPTPSEQRFALDLAVVMKLQEHGDPLTPKRDVRHYVYFPDRSSADDYAGRITTQGFTVEINQSGDEWCVQAFRDDSVEHPHISTITGPLADLAHELGGMYDGWEARLVQKKSLFGRLFKN